MLKLIIAKSLRIQKIYYNNITSIGSISNICDKTKKSVLLEKQSNSLFTFEITTLL